jgi:HEAT repeat protein
MASANKRLIEYHISRLQDKNPDVRLKAISELAHLPDPDGLAALRTVFENDTDIQVRRAAQEAGRAVFLKLKQEGAE